MLTLLNPAALWALAALALPLAIHLWRPPPRTVRLGSLRFLDGLPHRRLRNLRWREQALLAARLALLAALALLLAGPRWVRKPFAGPQRWALVDPAAAPAGPSLERLHRLRADGYALHTLAPGLPLAESPFAPGSSAAPPDLWTLLREADAALPAGSALAVFTPGRLASLRGPRPALRHGRVEWVPTPDAAGTAPRSWIESLRTYTAPGKTPETRALVGTSAAAATLFTAFMPPAPGSTPDPAVEFSPDGTRARLLAPETGPWARAANAPGLRVAILRDPDRTEDARHVEAAVRAVAAADGLPLILSVQTPGAPSTSPPAAGADWVFWLSAQPAPDGIPNLVAEAAPASHDQPATETGWITASPGSPGAAALSAAPVRLWRRTPAPPPSAPSATLWTDSHGEPLLTQERTTSGHRWNFYSRFSSDWSGLPRSPVLAAALRGLLDPEPAPLPADPAHDLRLADPSQYQLSLLPLAGSASLPARVPAPAAIDLHWPLWLLAALLFALERTLARKPSSGSIIAPAPVPAMPATAR